MYLRQSFSRLPATRHGGILLIDPIAEIDDNDDDDDDQDQNQIGVLITAAQPYSHGRGQGSRGGRGLGSRDRGSLSTESPVFEPFAEHEAVREHVYETEQTAGETTNLDIDEWLEENFP